MAHLLSVFPDIYDYLPKNDTNEKIQELSTWIDHSGDMADCYHGDQIRCYAYIVDDSTCVRTNTIATYTETNRQVGYHDDQVM